MRIALVHYHLQRGGVTRIIQHCVNSLVGTDTSVVVVTGKAPAETFPCEITVVPGLQYELHRPQISSQELARQMLVAATGALGGPPDIWHAHNHSLGKNLALPEALCILAQKGFPLFLHIHDFAEDGRPGNYKAMLRSIGQGKSYQLARYLYPRADHIHYGVLNTRDYCYLQAAGAEESSLHQLANPVTVDSTCEDAPVTPGESKPLWIYPTRAIRRKNIGEFLLWAALAPPGHTFATTLAPENPLEHDRYKRWVKVAQELRLPVEFEKSASQGCSFFQLLRQATGLVTTSIAEGFGMAFLEPWLVKRPLLGRNLPEITYEFTEKGVALPLVYERLNVPVAWLGLDEVVRVAREGLQQYMAAYGYTPEPKDYDRTIAAWVQDGCVDFGCLNESMQEQVLYHLVRSPEACKELNPSVLSATACPQEIIETNARVIQERFCLNKYGERLLAIYHELAGSLPSPLDQLDGGILIQDFLAPERLHLLRVD